MPASNTDTFCPILCLFKFVLAATFTHHSFSKCADTEQILNREVVLKILDFVGIELTTLLTTRPPNTPKSVDTFESCQIGETKMKKKKVKPQKEPFSETRK